MTTATKPTLTEAEAERIIDRMVQKKLSYDLAYLHAENAEEQTMREVEITEAVMKDVEEKYEIV